MLFSFLRYKSDVIIVSHINYSLLLRNSCSLQWEDQMSKGHFRYDVTTTEIKVFKVSFEVFCSDTSCFAKEPSSAHLLNVTFKIPSAGN